MYRCSNSCLLTYLLTPPATTSKRLAVFMTNKMLVAVLAATVLHRFQAPGQEGPSHVHAKSFSWLPFNLSKTAGYKTVELGRCIEWMAPFATVIKRATKDRIPVAVKGNHEIQVHHVNLQLVVRHFVCQQLTSNSNALLVGVLPVSSCVTVISWSPTAWLDILPWQWVCRVM